MAELGLAARFEGSEGGRRLFDLLKQQALVGDNEGLAARLMEAVELRELGAGDILIRQDEAGSDLFFLLSGNLRVLVNGREVANRRKGNHVGEMAMIDPAARRTATVVASEASLVAALKESDFISIANTFPSMWRATALELSRRLDQRKTFYRSANTTPLVFVAAARESLAIAQALVSQIPSGIAITTIWSEGLFAASRLPMEDLETRLEASDFAVLVAAPGEAPPGRAGVSDAPRDNMAFELGLFIGALGRRRTYLVLPRGESPSIPVGLLGLPLVHYDREKSTPGGQTQRAAEELIELVKRAGPK